MAREMTMAREMSEEFSWAQVEKKLKERGEEIMRDFSTSFLLRFSHGNDPHMAFPINNPGSCYDSSYGAEFLGRLFHVFGSKINKGNIKRFTGGMDYETNFSSWDLDEMELHCQSELPLQENHVYFCILHISNPDENIEMFHYFTLILDEDRYPLLIETFANVPQILIKRIYGNVNNILHNVLQHSSSEEPCKTFLEFFEIPSWAEIFSKYTQSQLYYLKFPLYYPDISDLNRVLCFSS
jgi:hypothetical protein